MGAHIWWTEEQKQLVVDMHNKDIPSPEMVEILKTRWPVDMVALTVVRVQSQVCNLRNAGRITTKRSTANNRAKKISSNNTVAAGAVTSKPVQPYKGDAVSPPAAKSGCPAHGSEVSAPKNAKVMAGAGALRRMSSGELDGNGSAITINELGPRSCKWPRSDGFYCGGPRVDNHPYCRYHGGLAYIPTVNGKKMAATR